MTRPDGACAYPSEPSCPACGETPMFRSQVHECCVVAGRLQDGVAALCDRYQGGGLAIDSWVNVGELRRLLAEAAKPETEARGG